MSDNLYNGNADKKLDLINFKSLNYLKIKFVKKH